MTKFAILTNGTFLLNSHLRPGLESHCNQHASLDPVTRFGNCEVSHEIRVELVFARFTITILNIVKI